MVFEIFLESLFRCSMISCFFQKRVQRYECYHSHQTFLKSFLAFILLKNFSFFKALRFLFYDVWDLIESLISFFSQMLFSKAGAKISVLPFTPNIFLFVIAFVLLKNLLRFCEAGRKDKFVMFTSKSFLIFIIHKRWNKDVACVSEEIKFFMFIQYVKKIIITLHIFFCMQLTRRQLHRTFQFL